MTTREDILKYAKNTERPIFEILLFEKVVEGGFSFPEVGCEDHPGFYYELDTAIRAMNENWADIQDHAFHAGFILCRLPGLYQGVTTNQRMYFVWDRDKEGFFQQEEPEIFKHLAY